MTIETKTESIRFNGNNPEDEVIVMALAAGALAVERFDCLQDHGSYNPWEEEAVPGRVDAIDGVNITTGLKLINPNGRFDEDHLELSVRKDEIPEILDAIEEAEELEAEGKVINLQPDAFEQTKKILHSYLDEYQKAA